MSDKLFHSVEDGFVTLYRGGGYWQAKLYQKQGVLYASNGGGFVRLLGGNDTTKPNTKWYDIVPPDGTVETRSGRFGAPVLERDVK